MNWTAYLAQNPALQSYWSGLSAAQKAQFQNDPARFAEWHWNTQGQQGGWVAPPQAPPPPPGPEQVMDQVSAGPLAQIARQGLDARNAYNAAQTLDEQQIAANAYNDQNQQAGAAYGGQLSLLDQDYLRRQGFTDAEIAAWEARAATERTNAENLVASRFGVRGDLGKSTRNIAEIGQQYAQDRALYEGGKRRADYEPYASGRYAAYGDLASKQEGNLANYWTNNAASRGSYWNRANSAYDTYQGGQAGAYSDWLNAFNRKSDMGYNATQLAVGAGQTAVNNINSATQNAADAASDAYLARGNANANMWNQAAYAAGNAFGSFKPQPSQPAPQPRTEYKPYGRDQYGSWYG